MHYDSVKSWGGGQGAIKNIPFISVSHQKHSPTLPTWGGPQAVTFYNLPNVTQWRSGLPGRTRSVEPKQEYEERLMLPFYSAWGKLLQKGDNVRLPWWSGG